MVADAPEDIKRIEGKNDHEPLHNAKLSPTGYYTGWFHKDYQGLYGQLDWESFIMNDIDDPYYLYQNRWNYYWNF